MYRVRRSLPEYGTVVLKQTNLGDCRDWLREKRDQWREIAEVGAFGGKGPYIVALAEDCLTLTVTQEGRVVDKYEVENV